MAKQPYIPLYIGDWEQDLNCVSLEAEGAALKLIFKLWKSPTKGLLRICYAQMAILFKKSEPETRKIFAELCRNNIFNVENLPNDEVEIKSRRMLRDAQLSTVRAEAGSEGGKAKSKNRKQNHSKPKAKTYQKPDNENDVGNENDIGFKKGGVGEFSKPMPPSLSMIENAFTENGLTPDQAKDFFDEVEGRQGWENIHNWKIYTQNAIVKRLKQKQNGKVTGNYSNRISEQKQSVRDVKNLAIEVLRQSGGGDV